MSEEERNGGGSWGVKYRPRNIDEMVGNVTTLEKAKGLIRGALKDPNSMPNTVGITGPTGTGKTTLARAMAFGINGMDTPDVVGRGTTDVLEFDCGANGQIDKVRELEAKAKYAPKGNFRVFILDEMHLLSRQAEGVILKLFEEPPPRARFIWCTDQPQKVLQTIRGRSFMASLTEPTEQELTDYLIRIVRGEKLRFGTKALRDSVLRSICVRSGNMPRRAANMLQETASIIAERQEAYGSDLDKSILHEIVSSLIAEEEQHSPFSFALQAAAHLYDRELKELRFVLMSFSGDIEQFLMSLVAINRAICATSSGITASTRYPKMVKDRRTKINKDNPVDPFAIQLKLAQLVGDARVFAGDATDLITARIATILD